MLNWCFVATAIYCSNCRLLAIGQEAACSRCGYLLDMRQKDPVLRPVLYAASSLFMLILANLFPFIGMDVAGNVHIMSFFDTSSVLFNEHQQWLAVLVWLFIQAIPAFCMLAVIYIKLGMVRRVRGLVWTARVLYMLKPWSMVDIFLIGILVAFVKLVVYADISVGMSFWAFSPVLFVAFAHFPGDRPSCLVGVDSSSASACFR